MGNRQELQEDILRIYSNAQNRILLYAQACLPQSQFQAFRKLILDELGLSGAEGKVRKVFEQGKGRHEIEKAKEDGEHE
jgi:hypothetical protein